MATLPAYFAQNPDVAAAYKENTYGLTPQQFADTHFALYGGQEQRAAPPVVEAVTSGNLSTLPAYFSQNKDVAQDYLENTYGLTPEQFAAAHYTQYGGTEQRASPAAVTAITSGDFSSLPKYFQDNLDVAQSYLKNTYGLTPEQFAAKHFELYGQKEQRVAPAGTKTVIPTTLRPTSVTPLPSPAPIAVPTVPVGQFRELFPSFAESKRLAGQMVANRPSTQSIIDMIQGQTGTPTTPIGTTPITTPINSGLPAYFTQNPDVAAAYAQNNYGMTPEQFALTHFQKFGQTEQRAAPVTTSALPAYFTQNPDVAASYLTNNYGLTPEQFAATHYQKFGQTEQRAAPTGTTATPSLSNVLSMIAK